MQGRPIRLKISARNMERLYWMLFVSPVILYLFVNIFRLGVDQFWSGIISVPALYSLPVLLLLYTVHEALHVVAGLIIGVKISSFDFGFDKGSLSITCGCREEISIYGYQLMLLLPFMVLTPILAGLAYFNDPYIWLMMLAFSTSGCAFDLTLSMGLIGIPGHTRLIPELSSENGLVFLKGTS